ncbi:hemolysin family protein [Candidatus Bipolaricaulota bacterium]|nr:hemolysin family protein [Candidatus Bipolaricaulota bacterium]
MSIGVQLVILAILVAFSGLCSSSETAVTSLGQVRVRLLSSKYPDKSKALEVLADDPNRLITSILILNNLVNIGASSIATLLFLQILPTGISTFQKGIITTLTMTSTLLVLGEITPKNFAKNNPEKYTLTIINYVYYSSVLLKPFIVGFQSLSHRILNLFSKEFTHREPARVSEEELKNLIDIAQERELFGKQEGEMIKRIFSYDDLTADEAMVPRTETHTIDANSTVEEAKQLVSEYGHSRYPVRDGQIDEIIGILYSKDLLMHSENPGLSVRELLRPVYYTPITKPINVLLREFQGKKIHLAVVLDEYGGMAGIITLEDILEEIVGEIEDEFDVHEEMIEELDNGQVLINGECEVKEINRSLGLNLPENSVTIGGLLIDQLEDIPNTGTQLTIDDVKLTIEKASKRRIKKVKLELPVE